MQIILHRPHGLLRMSFPEDSLSEKFFPHNLSLSSIIRIFAKQDQTKTSMKLDHIALYVKDLENTRKFFIDHFGAVSNDMYHNPKTGLKTYFLSFGDGARLEIMSRPDTVDDEKKHLRTGFIHLAFSAGGKSQVDSLTKRLHDAGYAVVSGPRTTGDGCYESCIEGPEGNLIEISE